jgi:hypothetical protein
MALSSAGDRCVLLSSIASSKWGTLGGDHLQDLLPEPMKRFVDPLF